MLITSSCKTKVADMEDETQISEAMASDKDVDLDTKESEEA